MSILTADGCVDSVATLPEAECCGPDLCNLDPCALMCIFIGLLPNGPLWDRAKAERMSKYKTDCHGGACQPENDCAHLVDYAIYSGLRLHHLLMTALWPALRESDPTTAVTTLDNWLERYGWRHCFDSACRDPRLGNVSEIECVGMCGPIYSPPKMPDALDCAVKRGIVLALQRLQMNPIPNLCGINWVIEPLGAVLRPYRPGCEIDGVWYPEAELYCCEGARFELCHADDNMIDACPGLDCGSLRSLGRIPAYFEEVGFVTDEAGNPCPPEADDCTIPENERVYIWPGVLAAHCIALSLMPWNEDCTAEIPIVRCAGTLTQV